MIEMVLLTGFLGAGKTTLISSMLASYQDKKVGVIVNEFGQINIDAKLIQKEGVEMAELSNGSIFCACIKDKFVDSLISLSHTEIEYLFIEASGLADPVNMPTIIKGIEHKTGRPYRYKGSICVVDGEHFLGLLDMLPALERQVEYGDVMIINKADRMKEEEIVEVSEQIQKINPRAQIFVTSYCKVDIRDLVENLHAEMKEGQETSNTVGSRPNTVILKAETPIPLNDLSAFLEDIAPDTYRIKGFAVTDQGTKEISAVGRDIHINPWDKDLDQSEIVVISSVGIRILSLVIKALEKKLKGVLHY